MVKMHSEFGHVAQFTINDYTLSVYVGHGSHSESKHWEIERTSVTSSDAEIALFNKEMEFILPDQIVGYQSAEAIARVLHVMLTKHDTDEALVQNVLAVLD